MIVEYFFNQLLNVIKIIFSITGALPDLPTSIEDSLDTLATYASQGLGFVVALLGYPFTMALFTIIVGLALYFVTWAPLVFIYKRIRG